MSDHEYRDDPEHFGRTADSATRAPGMQKPKDKPTVDPVVVQTSADWKDGVGPLGKDSPLNQDTPGGGSAATSADAAPRRDEGTAPPQDLADQGP